MCQNFTNGAADAQSLEMLTFQPNQKYELKDLYFDSYSETCLHVLWPPWNQHFWPLEMVI